jgi:hypothetical protein
LGQADGQISDSLPRAKTTAVAAMGDWSRASERDIHVRLSEPLFLDCPVEYP